MLRTTISLAVTSDGEFIHVDGINPRDDQHFICEECGSTLKAFVAEWGGKAFFHTMHDNLAICLALDCPARTLPVRKLAFSTVEQHWRCVVCDVKYYGGKTCPRCNDWASTVPDSWPWASR